MAKKEVHIDHIDESLAQDPNFIACQKAVERGQFRDLKPGTYVAYAEGELVGTGMDREQVLQEMKESNFKKGVYIHQVNVPQRVVHLRSPRRVRRPLALGR